MTRNRRREDDEWFALIQEARRSGLSDANWCELHGISKYSFWNAIARLRKKSYKIPVQDTFVKEATTEIRNDVVRLDFSPASAVVEPASNFIDSHVYLTGQSQEVQRDQPLLLTDQSHGSHSIEVTLNGATVRFPDNTNPDILLHLFKALENKSC